MSTSAPRGPRPARADRPRPAGVRVLRALAVAAGPQTIAALTAALGGHQNSVRAQLEHLVAAGFAVQVALPAAGRGRPANGYAATVAGRQVAGEDPRRDQQTALVEAVAEQLAATDAPVAAAEALGRLWGRKLGGPEQPGLIDALAAQGFTPEVRDTGIALLTCPLLAAARQRPEVVCAIHQGLLDALSVEPVQLRPFALPDACLVRTGTRAQAPADPAAAAL